MSKIKDLKLAEAKKELDKLRQDVKQWKFMTLEHRKECAHRYIVYDKDRCGYRYFYGYDKKYDRHGAYKCPDECPLEARVRARLRKEMKDEDTKK